MTTTITAAPGRKPGVRRSRSHGSEAEDAPGSGAIDVGAAVDTAHSGRSRSDSAGIRARAEAGMATAEYAIGTIAAAAFAGLLLVILRGDGVRAALEGLITQALSVG